MKKELLFSITKKDFKIDYFSGTGKGGQYRNKHQNCVRLRHSESGVIVTGQSHRERQANIKEAFNNLVNNPKFKLWHNRKVNEALTGKRIEDTVKEMMRPENIKVEVKEDGKWISEPNPPLELTPAR
jgi:peptide chain release factor 1